jgi:hypothetical protein
MMGAPFRVLSHENRPLSECFQSTGWNTGNLLIGNGLLSHLRYDDLQTYRYAMKPEWIEENFDQVVIGAANFLFPGFDLSPLANIIEKIKLPVFMVGLGAQLPSSESELDNIPEGTWRLVRLVSERSHSIGVRGYFTAEQLTKVGIPNARPTGCPSLYTRHDSTARLRRVADTSALRATVNGSRNVVGHSSDEASATRVERQLLQVAMANNYPYVLQNEQPEMQVAWGDDLAEHMPALASIAKFFGVDVEALVSYYRRSGKVFFSIEQWFDWIRDFDFSLGTRFHGNVAALLNGVPAVVITHDSRTKELCEFAAIPHAPVSAIETLDVRRLYEEADFDLYEERYNALYRAYIDFLDDNKVPHLLTWRPDVPPRGQIERPCRTRLERAGAVPATVQDGA